ncbi:MAG: hypothetical protein KKA73_04980 [Chloroflexi bacterium]|nr:hypothetical protein [Chloroflexota bacterium]MBU1747021.1 hypothetical protein [Chloroflexota bacterium]MBU1879691.1 hypothetical protein [Chloroflexota bacterium]
MTDDVTLAFDTSATVQRGFLALCDLANRVNERRKALHQPTRIELCVPAAAHTERLFDLCQQHGDVYDVEFVRTVLEQRGVQVPSYTVEDAEHCAGLLYQRFQTGQEWHAFKKRRCLECAGLDSQYHHLAQGTGQRCGAPVDWLIISQAHRQGMLLVMDDQGRSGEFEHIERKVRYSDVRGALEQIYAELSRQLVAAG